MYCNKPAISDYYGLPLTNSQTFDNELISSITPNLKQGKGEDIDGLSAEFCHPSVCVILAKLFQLTLVFFRYEWLSIQQRHSYSYRKECLSKALTCDDFVWIAISHQSGNS